MLIPEMLTVLLIMLNTVFATMVLLDEIPGEYRVTTTYNTTLNVTEFKICVNNDTSAQLLREDMAVNDSVLVYNSTLHATGDRMLDCLEEQGIDTPAVIPDVDYIENYERLFDIQEEIAQWISSSFRVMPNISHPICHC